MKKLGVFIRKYYYNVKMRVAVVLAKCGAITPTIVLRGSTDFSGNTGAFFRYLLSMRINTKYKIIWIIRNKESKNYYSKDIPNVYFFDCSSNFSMRQLVCIYKSKFLIWDNDQIVPQMSKRHLRKDQFALYLSHTTPVLKDMHKMINLVDVADCALCTHPELKEIVSYQYNIWTERLFINGHPKNDELFIQEDVLKKIQLRHYDKVLIWMPTFRSAFHGMRVDSQKNYFLGIPLIFTVEDLLTLDLYLQKYNVLLLIKLHFEQDIDNDFSKIDLKNIRIITNSDLKKKHIILYRLLNNCDALITDYSSIVFDFLLLDRPIGFVLNDFREYTIGFVTENPLDYMPGEKIYSFSDLTQFIFDVANMKDKYKVQREQVLKKTSLYRDNRNCERLYKFLLANGL